MGWRLFPWARPGGCEGGSGGSIRTRSAWLLSCCSGGHVLAPGPPLSLDLGYVPRDSGTGGEAGPKAVLEVPPPRPVNPVRGVARLLGPLVLLPSAPGSHKEIYPQPRCWRPWTSALQYLAPWCMQAFCHLLSLGGWRPPKEPRALRAQAGPAPGAGPRQRLQCGLLGSGGRTGKDLFFCTFDKNTAL